MEIMNTKVNGNTGGICTRFKHKDKIYYADLSFVYTCNECMIFPADEDSNVTSWKELYVKTGIAITEENLIKCIREFCRVIE